MVWCSGRCHMPAGRCFSNGRFAANASRRVGFLPRRSSLSQLLTIPQTLGSGGPGEIAEKKFHACAIRVLVGTDIGADFLPSD